MRKFVLAALGAATLAGGIAAAPLVFAQPAADAPRLSQRAHKLPSERIDARLAYAKAALKITPAQEAQWNALADVVRRHAQSRDERMTQRTAASPDQTLSAIDRLQRRQEAVAAEATRMNELLEAAKPLYASFTDEQKKEADALLSRGDQRRGHAHAGRSRGDHSHHDRSRGDRSHGSRWH